MKNDGTIKIIILIIIGFFLLKTCSNATKRRRTSNYSTSKTAKWEKSPVDEIIKNLSNEDNFAIILFDMDAEDQNSSRAHYKHQYKIIRSLPDTVVGEETQWYDVSEPFFQQNIDNMGMEIASKKDGVISKQPAPAGYSNYVGNPQYGEWREQNGSSFWSFYGKYAFLSSMFNLMTYPVHRSYWNDYHRNYYGTGRGYYGPSGQRIYGTRSYTSSTSGRSSSWAQKPSAFKSKVRSNVSRSTSASSSRSYSSSSSYNKTSRSSSRSASSTSYRSRSGGSGK